MRRYTTLLLVSLVVLTLSATPLLAGETATSSCTKTEAPECKEKTDCCKKADPKCCAKDGEAKECKTPKAS